MTYRVEARLGDIGLEVTATSGRATTSTATSPARLGGQVEVLRRQINLPTLADTLGGLMVRALQSPFSLWPVLTGRSKRGFDYMTGGSSGEVLLTNREEYAVYVEGYTSAAARTLRLLDRQIRDGLADELRRRLGMEASGGGFLGVGSSGLGRGFGRGPTRSRAAAARRR